MISEIKEGVKKILPSIEEMYNSKKNDVFAQIFKGPEGVKAFWEDMLNYPEVLWIGSGMYVPDRFPAFWTRKNIQQILADLARHVSSVLQGRNDAFSCTKDTLIKHYDNGTLEFDRQALFWQSPVLYL